MATFNNLQNHFAALCGLLVIISCNSASASTWLSSESYDSTSGVEFAGLKRGESKTFEIPFNITQYFGEVYGFNCTLGSPPQNITMAILLEQPDSHLLKQLRDPFWPRTFNYNKSTTYKSDILIASLDNTSSILDKGPYSNLYNISNAGVRYSSDRLAIPGVVGSATLEDMAFVSWTRRSFIGQHLSSDYSLDGDSSNYYWIGLGLAVGQSALWPNFGGRNPIAYPTLTQRLINAGVIQSNTFSMWFDEYTQKTGHLLLGGINSKRYQDSLVDLPTSLSDFPNSFGFKTTKQLAVGIKSITVNAQSANGNVRVINAATTVDGVTLVHLDSALFPADVARAIWDAVGAEYDAELDPFNDQVQPIVPCSFLSNSSTINIQFSGAPNLTLSVPMSHITARNGTGPDNEEGPYGAACKLLIMGVPEGLPPSLSRGMMKSLYTVYDLENNIISIALTNFDSKDDNLISIPTGGVASIPREAFNADEPSASVSASQQPDAGSDGNSKRNLAIGLGVGIPAFLILCAVAAFSLLWGRRKRNENAAVKVDGGSGAQTASPGELDGSEARPKRSELQGIPVMPESEHKNRLVDDSALELPVGRNQEGQPEQRAELA